MNPNRDLACKFKRLPVFIVIYLSLCMSLFAWAATGTIPNRSYNASQVFKKISPVMGADHHNQSHVIDGYVFIGSNAIYEIWDISNPFQPSRLARVLSPHRFGEAEAHMISFNQDGASRYAVTISGRGIDTWDITNIKHPLLLHALTINGINYGDNTRAIWGVYWQGDYIYVGGTNTGLHIVDASNPARLRVVRRVPTAEFGGISAGPLYAIGNLLVITTPKGSAGIATLDISDPLEPVLLDVVKSGVNSYIGGFYGANAHLLTPFRTYDVTSDPSNIRLLGQAGIPKSEYMSFGDGYLFLGSVRQNIGGNNGIYKIDISNPSRAPVIGRIPGRNNRNIDDQFSVPIGNLVVVSDDEVKAGSFLAVHAAKPDTKAPKVQYVNPRNGATG